MRVTKRDGHSVEPFKLKEIRKALLMSFSAIGRVPDISPIEGAVVRRLHADGKSIVSVDDILDAIEHVLMDAGYNDVAKRFILYRETRNIARAKRLVPDSKAVEGYIHASKYAKYLSAERRREVYSETVDRDDRMHRRRFKSLGTPFESRIAWAFGAVHRKEVLPSMRSMQFGGLAVEKNNERLYNCCFTHVDRTDVFSKIFYLLLCGCGVGYSIQWRHVDKLPALKKINQKNVVHWVIEDSIEGWGDAAEMLMQSFFMTGKWVEFSYHKIRDEGSILKTSGGRAPGHIPLRKALEAVRKLLMAAQGRKLRPIEIHDILCHFSIAVLSGGIRRSAMIALFSPEDTEMLYAKTRGVYEERPDGLNYQRQMANNSAVFLRGTVDEVMFRRVLRVARENFGDPGFIFVNDLDHGTNPCGEIGLYPVLWEECSSCKGAGRVDGHRLVEGFDSCKECLGSGSKRYSGFAFCNLTSINCSLFDNQYDFYKAAEAAAFIGTLQAAYTSFPYLGPVSEKIAQRDALLGVSLNGMMDCPEIALNPEYQREAAAIVRKTNIEIAAIIGINAAARLTAVKPEGTSSLELGCIASGHHLHHAPRHLRRITGNLNEPPVQAFIEANPHMVEYKPNGDVALVFPVQTRQGALCISDMTAQEFVEAVMSTYENWVVPGTVSDEKLTHNVSCTVTLKDGEDVTDYVWENRHRVAAMTFVPHILDKLYPFAPREAITTPEDETYWNRLIAGYKAVDWTAVREEEDNTNRQMANACAGPKGCDV